MKTDCTESPTKAETPLEIKAIKILYLKALQVCQNRGKAPRTNVVKILATP